MSPSGYVALAYGVVFAFVVVYVAIIAAKLVRLERETAELAELAQSRRDQVANGDAPVAHVTREA